MDEREEDIIDGGGSGVPASHDQLAIAVGEIRPDNVCLADKRISQQQDTGESPAFCAISILNPSPPRSHGTGDRQTGQLCRAAARAARSGKLVSHRRRRPANDVQSPTVPPAGFARGP